MQETNLWQYAKIPLQSPEHKAKLEPLEKLKIDSVWLYQDLSFTAFHRRKFDQES